MSFLKSDGMRQNLAVLQKETLLPYEFNEVFELYSNAPSQRLFSTREKQCKNEFQCWKLLNRHRLHSSEENMEQKSLKKHLSVHMQYCKVTFVTGSAPPGDSSFIFIKTPSKRSSR